MKQWITGAALVALAFGYTQRADASIYISINDGDGNVFTCDNGVSVSVCAANGFLTTANGNLVSFNGTFGDYTFSGASGVNADVPGTPGVALATDSKVSVTHDSGTTDLTVIFAAYGFTAPVSGGNFSSSATANWSTSVSTDTSTSMGWADANNGKAAGVGLAANAGTCTTPGGATISCSDASSNVAFTNPNGTYSLIGEELIHLAPGANQSGSIGTFTATETVSAVPEPMTFSLLGAGLLGLGLLRKRISRS